MGNLYKTTERNRNGWISRLRDGCELVCPKNGAGLYCLSDSFSLLYPLLLYFSLLSLSSPPFPIFFLWALLSHTFGVHMAPDGSPVLNSICPLAPTTDQESTSQSLILILGTRRLCLTQIILLNQGPQTMSLDSQWLTPLGSGVCPGSVNCDPQN